jgi:hypothetical protein
MPTISVAKIRRKFNLGNYESMEVGLEAFVGEGENVQQVLATLEAEAKKYMQNAHPEASKPAAEEKPKTAETIQNAFPPELKELLTFEQNNQAIIIRPRGFLGNENFCEIAKIVKAHSGEYVSAGKNSHFRVPLR